MFIVPYLLLYAYPFFAPLIMTDAENPRMVNHPPAKHESPMIDDLNSQATNQKLASMEPSAGSGQRTARNTDHTRTRKPIQVLISDTCIKQDSQGDSGTSPQHQGKELDLEPGYPLVLTHRISLLPGSCNEGCDSEFEALRGRLNKLEKEVSTLKEKCGGLEEGCCKKGTGVGCSECPNECSDQGRCVEGKCICFPGFTGPDCSAPTCPSNCSKKGNCVNGQCVCESGYKGPDCSETVCPNNCHNKGRCVNGKCVCDSGFTGLHCSEKACPNNCHNKGRCVNGKCVCDSGFTGLDCSEKACPNNCHNKGRCVNGKCVCDSGFTGLDCSEKACPNNCHNKGRCVNGKCVCDSGFTGLDCSEKACPNNCHNKGRCVNGKCVCDSGFMGPDCSDKSCPNDCSENGRCVKGKCVCDAGFMGLDCSAKSCPGNCNNRGRCMKGKCLCRRGFTGPDCSQCQAGFTGPDCSTALSSVRQLRTRDITDSSVTIFWSPPPVQYDLYHITFTSKKEGDQKVTATTAGHLTAFTQTGLAAGQEYTVTVRGEKDGAMGQESTILFTTLISGPKNLRVVKTTSTTAVVQWEPPLGDIDRYRLSVSPSQTEREETGAGSKNKTLPPDRNSAHIESLEVGRLYNISLVAQKGRSQSQPITVQVTPGLKLIPLRKPKAQYNGTRTGPSGVRRVDPIFKTQPGYIQPLGQATQINGSMLPTQDEKEIMVMMINLKKNSSKEVNVTQYPTKNIEKKPLSCNGIQSYTSIKRGSEYRSTSDPEVLKQKRNGTETQMKKCIKTVNVGFGMAGGNGTMVGKDLSRTRPFHDNSRNGSSEKKGNTVDQTDAPKTTPFLRNHQLVKNGTINLRILNTTQTSMNYRKQVSTAGTSARVPISTDSSKHSPQTPTYLLPSSSSSSAPSTSFPSSSRKTTKDTQKPSRDQLRESHIFDRVTTPVPLPGSSIPLSTLAPNFHKAETPSRVSGKEGEPVRVLTENENKVEENNEEVILRGDGKEIKKIYGKMPPHRQPTTRIIPFDHFKKEFYNRSRPIYRHSQHPFRPKFPMIKRGNNSSNGKVMVSPKGWVINGTIRRTHPRTKIIPRNFAKTNNITDGKMRPPHMGYKYTSGKTGEINKSEDTVAGEEKLYSKVGHGGQTNRTQTESHGLHSFDVQDVTSRGFILIWEAPAGMFQNFIININESKEGKENSHEEESEADSKKDRKEDEKKKEDRSKKASRDPGAASGGTSLAHIPWMDISSSSINDTADSLTGPQSSLKLKVHDHQKVVPGTVRSLQFHNLHPQTRYNVSLYGTGPGIRSKIQHLVIHTGPEPPSELTFSKVTDSSFSVSWKKPKSPVTGFKVTYIHMPDGESTSVSLNSHQTTVPLSALSPGSSYDVSVISTLDRDESDPVKDLVVTAPDPPTDLRVVNVTDSKALLLWRPALASVDQYDIVYGSEKGSVMAIAVTGNVAEQQLKGLQGSTVYTVTVTSKLKDQHSRAVTTQFTTTSGAEGRGEGPWDLKASQVTSRSAVLSWKAPTASVSSYKLTYQTAGQETKEVILDGSVTQHKLWKLSPTSQYIVQLKGERQGQHTATISTEFTTGMLRFPYPSDCSQELLNGIPDSGEVEIFPNGNQGPSALVYCDMETDGGGWTVIQRRMDGKTNFFRRWREYSAGFGNISGEFWIGNGLLHNLTQMTPMTLRVDLHSGSETAYARYSSFFIDTEKKHYAMKVSGYSGTAGDSMKYHDGRPFSTRDRDPNPFITRCAMSYRGGWWYRNCHETNLNGLYDTHTNHQGVIWTAWKGKDFSIPFTEMKIRPASFAPTAQA